MHLLQAGACNGAIKLAIQKNRKNQSAIIFALLLLAKEFNFIVFMHSCNNDTIFWDSMAVCH